MENHNLKFCIGVPVYNTDHNLFNKCLQSIINQTYTNFLVIIFDDCSNNNIYKIAKQVADYDSRFVVFRHVINSGATKTREDIINKAQGEGDLFMWIDSDDWVETDYLQKCYERIFPRYQTNPDDVYLCNAVLHKSNNKKRELYKFSKKTFTNRKAKNLVLADSRLKSYPWTFIIPVKMLQTISFDGAIQKGKSIVDDLAISYQYVKFCNNLRYINIKSYHHIFGVENSDSNNQLLRQRLVNTYKFLLEENKNDLDNLLIQITQWNISFNTIMSEKQLTSSKKQWFDSINQNFEVDIKKLKIHPKCLFYINLKTYISFILLKYLRHLFCFVFWNK